jgi:hypothetical protein
MDRHSSGTHYVRKIDWKTCDFIGEKLIVCSKTMHGNAWWRLIVKYSTRLVVFAKRVGMEGLGVVLLAGELG